MKKRMMILTLVTALLLTAVCGAAGETDMATAIQGTWVMADFDGEGIDSWVMTFRDGTVTVQASGWGEEFTTETDYSISGDTLIMNGAEAPIVLDGDTLKITDSGATMTLVRADSALILEGTWVMTDFTGTDAPESFSMTFGNGTCRSIATFNGETYDNEFPCSLAGSVLTLNGADAEIKLDGDTLMITAEGETMTLVRQAADPLLEGTWVMTECNDPEIESWAMTFSNGSCTVNATGYGQTIDETVPYTVDGDQITMNGSSETFTLDGDTLTIYNSETTLVLVRK